MSLITCPECKKEISNTANVCPNCGYSNVNKKYKIPKINFDFAIICLLIALFFIIPMCHIVSPSYQKSEPPRQAPSNRIATIDKSKDKQAKREYLLQEYMKKDILQKVVNNGSYPEVWVKPMFYVLDFDIKQQILGVAYAYFYDGSESDAIVMIYDSMTGKEVGSYMPRRHHPLEMEQ